TGTPRVRSVRRASSLILARSRRRRSVRPVHGRGLRPRTPGCSARSARFHPGLMAAPVAADRFNMMASPPRPERTERPPRRAPGCPPTNAAAGEGAARLLTMEGHMTKRRLHSIASLLAAAGVAAAPMAGCEDLPGDEGTQGAVIGGVGG